MYNNNIFESEVNILLECKNLVKDYQTSNEVVHALKEFLLHLETMNLYQF